MMSTERSKAAHVLDHENIEMTSRHIILTLCRFHREREPGWLQKANTLLIGTRDLLPLVSTCRCSRTKGWKSAFAGSISDPLIQPRSSSLSGSCPKMWKAEKLSPPMTISGQKQLSPCPIGERAATVERMVLTKSSRKRPQSLRNSLRRKLLLIFSRDDNRRVPSKKCSSAIAPKHEWFGSMYASTSLSRANHYSASPFATNSTRIARVHRMPNNRSQHAQSPIRWNCVQLKWHRQCDPSMTKTGPSLPKSRLPKEDWTKSDTENFLVRPVELRIQLGVLLEIPSLSWLGNDPNMEWPQKSILVPQPRKKMPRQCHTVWKWKLHDSPKLPKMRKLGKLPQGSLNLLPVFSGRYMYQRESDEESARSWTYRSRIPDGTSGSCFWPYLIDVENANDSLLLKENSKMKEWKMQMN